MAAIICVRRDEARRYVLQAKSKGKKLGLVPTMGAIHQGHLSLVKASTFDCDYTVVTVFVNPTQFGPGEDYHDYPRNLDRDVQFLEELGVDLVFAPNTEEVFRPEHSTFVQPPNVALSLEGEFRPEHFRGVATVVLKLIQIIPADVVYFGQKDYQQTRVIADMVADLDLPVSVQACPVIRERDGLALSSRNAYLSAAERVQAVSLSESLALAVKISRSEDASAESIQRAMMAHLNQAGVTRIDYVAIVHPFTLKPVERVTAGTMALIAAYVGTTRLIDNTRLG